MHASAPSLTRLRSAFDKADRRFRDALITPVDIAPLVYFRIVFGAVMFWEVTRYWSKGWIAAQYIRPTLFFSYPGFEWVQPWPGDGMYLHFLLLGALALCILFGLWYRVTMPLFFLAFSYVFLLDQTRYLNHFYLIVLVSFLMVFIPAHRAGSLDSWRKPPLHLRHAPAWSLWLLRFQLGIAYVYGGIAKLNGDWLRGEPMRMWLANRTDFPVIGGYFEQEWMVYFFSYGGLAFDLLIVPLLLWRPTRLLGILLATTFHLTNAHLFKIGIFPWFMLAATPVFLPPSWPRRFRLGRLAELRIGLSPTKRKTPVPAFKTREGAIMLVAAYVTLQVLVPFRHILYPGDVNWTEEGHNFSWHMKLRNKSGKIQFRAVNTETNRAWTIDPADYLTRTQRRKLAGRPEMIRQFSHFLSDTLSKKEGAPVAIYANARVALNDRPYLPLIDTSVNLAAEPYRWGTTPWILPLPEPKPQVAAKNP